MFDEEKAWGEIMRAIRKGKNPWNPPRWKRAIATMLGGTLVRVETADKLRMVTKRLTLEIVGFGEWPETSRVSGDRRYVDVKLHDAASGETDDVRLGLGDTYTMRIAAAVQLEELSPLG